MNTIQASELRIGNLVEYDGKNYPILAIDSEREFEEFKGSVTLPEYDSDGHQWTTYGRWVSKIKPIPLNEDWLIKFGFKKIGGELWDCNHVRGLFANNEFTPLAYLRPIKYVHDLMNLYFALTGTELTLTDK